MHNKGRKVFIVLFFILLSGAGVVIGRKILIHRLEQSVREKILLLNQRDLHISFDTLFIDWSFNQITAENVLVTKNSYDTTCIQPEFIKAKKVSIEGFDFISYLFRKHFNIDRISIENPHLVIHDRSKLLARDSARVGQTDAIINVRHVQMPGAEVSYVDVKTCELRSRVETTITLSDLNLLLIPGRRFNYSFTELRLDSSRVFQPSVQYEFSVQKVLFNSAQKTVSLDSIQILPQYSRLDFGRQLGFEMDRFEGSIPFIRLRHFRFEFEDTLGIAADKLETQLLIKVFRDRRLPNKKTYKKLPIEALRSLSVGLYFDTITITKSYISYQEVSPEVPNGFTTFFDNLDATMLSITNNPQLTQGKSLLTATSNVNGQGSIHLECTMPWSNSGNYFAKGSARNVSMTKFNPALEQIANIKVESGKLEKLSFNFRFNKSCSNGDVALEYKDLKLVSLRDDEEIEEIIRKNKWTVKDPKDYKVNPFKSFLLNTFVVKKNPLAEKNADGERAGAIQYCRDPSKSVFNYLWKSVFSGVKDAYHLDKLQAKIDAKNDRKEKRKERRQRKNS